MTESRIFGNLPDGRSVHSVTISDGTISAEILDYGATLRSLFVPDRNGRMTDVVLGYDSVTDYVERSGRMGATIGRFANRISYSRFTLDGKEFKLSANNGRNHIHGGKIGFDRRIWDILETKEDSVTFGLVSEDGEEGYPGRLEVSVKYSVHENSLTIDYHAVSDRDTICNLTNHAYFNLASEGTVNDHHVVLFSNSYLEMGSENIPTGKILPVNGTAHDLRKPSILNDRRFDDCYILSKQGNFAEVYCERSGIMMTVSTDMPAVQFYTADNLKDCRGKNGASYVRRSGLCLETEFCPDSPNRPEFPSCVLRVNQTYRHGTTYSFQAMD